MEVMELEASTPVISEGTKQGMLIGELLVECSTDVYDKKQTHLIREDLISCQQTPRSAVIITYTDFRTQATPNRRLLPVHSPCTAKHCNLRLLHRRGCGITQSLMARLWEG
jgi:hypothetical protein